MYKEPKTLDESNKQDLIIVPNYSAGVGAFNAMSEDYEKHDILNPDLFEDNELKPKVIKYDNRYVYDIKNNSLPERQTIGIIPYIWDETREYYKKIYYSNLYNQKRDMHNYIPKTKEVTISTPYRKILRKRNLFTFLDEEGEKDK